MGYVVSIPMNNLKVTNELFGKRGVNTKVLVNEVQKRMRCIVQYTCKESQPG